MLISSSFWFLLFCSSMFSIVRVRLRGGTKGERRGNLSGRVF